MGRQKIREELSAALAKGYLTRMDQYRILLHAKDVLTPDDLHGLEQTLNRIATRASSRPSGRPRWYRAKHQFEQTPTTAPETVTPSKYEEPRPEKLRSSLSRGRKTPKSSNESPAAEEIPAGIGKPAMHLDSDDPEGCGCDPDECRPR